MIQVPQMTRAISHHLLRYIRRPDTNGFAEFVNAKLGNHARRLYLSDHKQCSLSDRI